VTHILETKELHDAKANIAAGMDSLMKRAIRQTKTPEEREAGDREAAQNLRDEALIRALDINNRGWWAFVENAENGDTVYHDLEWRAGGLGWWRIVGHDPDVFEMFREMTPTYRRRYMERVKAAPLPQTVHPMQLADLATGEYRVAA
jgi:hypothetical protein